MLKGKKESNFSLVQLVFVHYPSILTNFLRVTEHFSDQNRALRLSILAGKRRAQMYQSRQISRFEVTNLKRFHLLREKPSEWGWKKERKKRKGNDRLSWESESYKPRDKSVHAFRTDLGTDICSKQRIS